MNIDTETNTMYHVKKSCRTVEPIVVTMVGAPEGLTDAQYVAAACEYANETPCRLWGAKVHNYEGVIIVHLYRD